MAVEIFKNDEDNILFGQDGNCFKSPFNFGNSFRNKMGLNNYIEIPNLSLAPVYTAIISTSGYNSGYDQILFNIQNTNLDNYSFQAENAGAQYLKYLKNWVGGNQAINAMVAQVSAPKRIINGVIIPGTTQPYKLTDGLSITTSTSSAETNNYNISKIWIGAARNANGSTPNYYSHSTLAHNRFLLYSRELSLSEIKYLFDNGQCDEPQSTVGLEIYIKLNQAELLNISGIDQVGVRDISGNNRHGRIVSLPVGSDAEKIAYANTNLLTP